MFSSGAELGGQVGERRGAVVDRERGRLLALAAAELVVLGDEAGAEAEAKKGGVDLRTYQIIYEMLADIRAAMEGLLKPEEREVVKGRAQVKEVYPSSKFGAVAGVMVAANDHKAQAYMGTLVGLKAFTAAVLGGIGNLGGAVAGGFLLGVIESVGAGYLGPLTNNVLGSQYQDIFAFLVLILVLVFRPSGLLGEKMAERA